MTPRTFHWRSEGHDDADAEDARLLGLRPDNGNGGAVQPLGELLPAYRNLAVQARQDADAQRRRAARAEARYAQLRSDLAWVALGVGLIAFALGFTLAWSIIRRGGGL
jgi:hypothetical protein